MMATEQITEILNGRNDGIGDIQVHPEGFVRARLVNQVDANRPYPLVVDPIVKESVLRVYVLLTGRTRPESNICRALARANLALRCGCVGMSADGEIAYQINHVCQPDGGDALAGSLLDLLLDEAVAAVRYLEKTILFGHMIDVGIPQNRAEQVMNVLFPDQVEDAAAEEMTL